MWSLHGCRAEPLSCSGVKPRWTVTDASTVRPSKPQKGSCRMRSKPQGERRTGRILPEDASKPIVVLRRGIFKQNGEAQELGKLPPCLLVYLSRDIFAD